MVNGEWLRDSPGLYDDDNDDENRQRSCGELRRGRWLIAPGALVNAALQRLKVNEERLMLNV